MSVARNAVAPRTAAAAAVAVAFCCFAVTMTTADVVRETPDEETGVLMDVVDRMFEIADTYELAAGVRVKRATPTEWSDAPTPSAIDRVIDPEKYVFDKVARFVGTHILDVDFAEMFRSAGRAFISLRELTHHPASRYILLYLIRD